MFAKFKLTNGQPIYINIKHVSIITQSAMTGETQIVMENTICYTITESIGDAIGRINE